VVWDSGVLLHISENQGFVMAQAITSWFISDGRFRVQAINAVGRRSARIIEIEDVDTGELFHGSARKLQRMFESLALVYLLHLQAWLCAQRSRCATIPGRPSADATPEMCS
jgi:hypothetical protein